MSLSFDKNKSLSLRITTTIWTICGVLLFVFIFLLYGFERQQLKTHMDHTRILLEGLFQQKHRFLADQIIGHQHADLRRTLEEIKQVQGIGAVHLYDAQGHLEAWAGVGLKIDLPLEPHADLAQNPFYETITFQGHDYLTFASTVEKTGHRLGYLAIYYNLSDLQSASRERLFLIMSLFSGILVIMSVILHFLLTRSVTRPVSLIRNAMEKVMQGQLETRVALNLKDEMGAVASSFNAMAEQIQEQRQRLLKSMALRDSYAEQLEETNRKLARLNANLESIVERRTHELRASNEKLRNQIQERIRSDQAKQELEERLARSQKMEALGLLAGGVAHDLNNVLSGIVSYPELILMEMPPDDPCRNLVHSLQRSGQKAAAIVQDLLALARRGVSNTEVLNLNDDIIQDELKSPEYGKLQSYHPKVTVTPRLTPDLMNIRGSAVHLRKALMNLISNAMEAQPDGGRIIIDTENRYVDRPISGYDRVNEGDYVVLKVEDYGMGISQEDLGRIFEPFYTKKIMGRSGTGLGMAVVWGTVQDHRGYINVQSEPGHGTMFELYFPVTREEINKQDTPVCLAACNGTGETVLVIDDVEEQRTIAAALLSRLNYKVETVESGEAAIIYLKKQKADILVLDMIMDPGIDGLETYSKILDMYPSQKAVIASGYAENERVKEAQKLGAGPYVRKPYTLEKIALAIRHELDR
jgi:signal transduction histidine kinase/CheY-like chemotaxis protein/HAMP domain-containing protein